MSARPAAARDKFEGARIFLVAAAGALHTAAATRKTDATHVGVVEILKCKPKVAPVSQPWAEWWNPVGIQRWLVDEWLLRLL